MCVTSEDRDGVVLIKLTGGEINAINLQTIEALSTVLDDVVDTGTKAVAFTSESEKFYSIGFDLPRVLDMGQEGIIGFYDHFNELCLRMYTLPIPTITAIPGHAVAGGCILASMTDFRFMAEGRGRAGVNELKLGLPVPYLASAVLTQVLGDRNATNMIFSGHLYEAQWLHRSGFVDQLLSQDQLIDEAILFIQEIGASPAKAFNMVKSERTDPVKRAFLENRENDRSKFLECWFSEESQALLQEAKKKF